MAAPPGVPIEDVEEQHMRLGTREEVVAAVCAALPEVELSERYARVEGETYTVELNLGDDDPVQGMSVRVQGGDEAVEPLLRLCAHTGWRALDISTGGFLDEADDPAAGLRGWRAFRNRVIDDS
jgi:hypothetical protein